MNVNVTKANGGTVVSLTKNTSASEILDENVARYNVAGTFTSPQRTSGVSIFSGTVDFRAKNDYFILLGTPTVITATNALSCNGQSGVFVVSDIENVVGWSGFDWLGTYPTLTTGLAVFSYKIVNGIVYMVKVENV